MKMFTRIIIVFFLLTTVVNVPHAMGQLFFFKHPLIGKTAPDFTLDMVDKEDVNFEAFRDGNPAIIFFWATWCPHCRTQIKVLNQEASTLKEKGIMVAVVDLQESVSLIKRYMNKNKIDLDIFLDRDANVASEYGLQGVPTFVFIDQEGVVKAVEHSMPEDYQNLIL